MKDLLKKESQKWVDSDIITQEQLDKIHELYPAPKTNSLVVVFAIIGSLLIGTGIILIFASNWWSIPIFFRAVLAFIPLLLAHAIGIYCYRKQYLSTAFREGIGLFLMLAVFANIALIGQIFHTGGDMYTYMGICFLLSLPSIYFFESFAAFTAYMVGTTSIALYAISLFSYDRISPLPLLLLAAILPFIIMTLKKEISKAKENLVLTLSALLTIALLIFFFCLYNLYDIFPPAYFLWFSLPDFIFIIPILLIALDAFYNHWKKKYDMTSFRRFGIIIQSGLLIVCVFSTAMFYNDWFLPIGPGNIPFLFLATFIYLVPKALSKRWFTPTDAITIATGLLVLLNSIGFLSIITASIVAFLLGIYFIYVGSKRLTFRHLNYGLLFTFGVILVRFFSSNLSILIRGIIFLVLGIAFLMINLWLSKKRKELVA